MLQQYVESLVSTDYRRPPLDMDESIDVRALDAEQLAGAFGPNEFDLVYSSNMLEHVRDPVAVLRAVHHVLKEDGISIHVMPNRFWKMCHVVLHVPQLALTALDALITTRRPSAIRELLKDWRAGGGPRLGSLHDNNPTLARPARSLIARALLPEPHGISPTNREEFAAFSRRRWREDLGRAGFDLVAVLKGPLSSGYGFGYSSIRQCLERLGITSEFVYVAKKKGGACRFEAPFAKSR
jgi:SAM-dependent methyltransferase